MKAYNPYALSASILIGDEVIDREGKHLGEINDVILDLKTGQIAYAVLAVEGSQDAEEKLFALPWAILAVDTEHRRFVFNADRQRLVDAPGIDRSNWPLTPDRVFIDDLYRHYGYAPYYQPTAAGRYSRSQQPAAL